MPVIGTSLADFMKHSEQLLVTIEANKADLAHLEPLRAQLAPMVDGAKEALVRQGTLKAEAQQASRDLDDFLTKGRDLATRLRHGIRAQYGTKTEKLVEFGLNPLRPGQRTKTAKQAKAKAPTTAPPSSAPDAAGSPEGTPNKPSVA
jgi:hypothetical protein